MGKQQILSSTLLSSSFPVLQPRSHAAAFMCDQNLQAMQTGFLTSITFTVPYIKQAYEIILPLQI